MATRLQVQENIKNILRIQNVRVIQDTNHFEINVYLENPNNIPETIFKNQIIDLCPAHLKVNIKPYNNLLMDQIPSEEVFPELVEHFALHTTGNMKSFTDSIHKVLIDVNIVNINFDKSSHTIFIEINPDLTVEDNVLFTSYANEIAPLGTSVKIFPAP